MSGRRHEDGLAMAAMTAEWRSRPGTWRIRPTVGISYGRTGLWKRALAGLKRFGLKVEASVSPSRATKRLEAELANRQGITKTTNITSPSPRSQTHRHQRR